MVEEKEECKDDENCPSLIKLASTPFEKAVAQEFVDMSMVLQEVKVNVKWLKYLITGIFGTGVISLGILIIKTIWGI